MHKYILSVSYIVCCIFLLCSCNNEDDMNIFVGQTWKISNIFTANSKPISEEDWKTLTASEDRFYIKFENSTSFSGRTLTQEFSGTWNVDLRNRTISFTLKNTGNPSDKLSKQVIESLQRISSYEGDYNYMRFIEHESPAYILFRRISQFQ